MGSFDLLKIFFDTEILNQKILEDDIIQDEIRKCLHKVDNYIKEQNFVYENHKEVNSIKIKRIFINLYDINQKNSTLLNNYLRKNGYFTGAKERKILKEYLDYRDNKILKKLSCYDENIEKFIQQFIITNDIVENVQYEIAKDMFIKQVLEQKNTLISTKINDKIYDRILAIYSAFIQHNELEKEENILKLYEENKEEILNILGEEFSKEFYDELFLLNQIDARKKIAGEFSRLFLKIRQKKYQKDNPSPKFSFDSDWNKLKSLLNEDYDCIYFKITQEFFSKYKDYDKFMNLLLNTLKELYEHLKNHRLLAIKVENIYVDGKNIKWDIYSKLSIYAENFRKEKLGSYYNPSKLYIDFLQQKYPGIHIEKNIEKSIELSYKKNDENLITDILKQNYPKGDLLELLDIYRNYQEAYLGFNYIDTFILNRKGKYQNEIKKYDYFNELLLIFEKNRIESTKIPCPSCGSLKISGNSFPKVGVRSWECKNLLCPDRSKSNRGKRYSERTIIMQYGYENGLDKIEKGLINYWRKDVSSITEENQIIEMLIKYYTFSNEKVLMVNTSDEEVRLGKKLQRDINTLSLFNNIKIESLPNIYIKFFKEKRGFLQNIFYITNRKKEIYKVHHLKRGIDIIQGNCVDYFSDLSGLGVSGMVTSPPYYNARDYSIWNNIYSYLNDMFTIIKGSYSCLKQNGIFLYNIGDITGNPNNIVYSKMGEKKIPLGAYTILLFQEAGFELVENYIWYKREPQSQRHKNDGKYTPLYQNPMNTYEHMFLFKKKGEKIKINTREKISEKWFENTIVDIEPVRKINSKKENILGHSAPFPYELPEFLIKIFTESGDIILDPFLGSGTTLIEAKKLDRRGIGIELLDEYVQLSIRRIDESTSQKILNLD